MSLDAARYLLDDIDGMGPLSKPEKTRDRALRDRIEQRRG